MAARTIPAVYLGIGQTSWIAWTAIGTLALALATVIAIRVAIRTTAAERRHDDARRKEDRDRDDARRAEDRQRDDAKRAEDRQRDDLLRREAADAIERREAAERRAREDYEARQVLVTIEAKEHPTLAEFTHYITVSTPHAYPIKQVDGQLAGWRTSQMGATGFGHAGDEPWVDENRVHFGFWSHSPDRGEYPIIRFVDWHGNRYYQYRHYTDRFGQNTDYLDAAQQLDSWIRTGPKPD